MVPYSSSSAVVLLLLVSVTVAAELLLVISNVLVLCGGDGEVSKWAELALAIVDTIEDNAFA